MKPSTVDDLCRLSGPDRVAGLEWSYRQFNHRRFRGSDPVSFVWSFSSPEDREIAAWAAAGLAYGRVGSILKALEDLNQRWDHAPTAFLSQASRIEQEKAMKGFIYRWTRPLPLLGYLRGYHTLRETGSVAQKILLHSRSGPCGYREGMKQVVRDLLDVGEEPPGHLLPNPSGNSACKRVAMWLRWMVRKDEIDPGPWADVLQPDRLWVPLDTHIFRIAKRMRLTHRKQPDAEAARRITASFARMCPEDPLRYDFAITRLGMKVES